MNETTYVVPVSGGKDSQAVLQWAIAEHGRDRVVALHHWTGIDSSVTYAHIAYMSAFYGVPIGRTHNPKYEDVLDLIEKRKMVPGRLARVCTEEFKIRAFGFWLDKCGLDLSTVVVLMGMRGDESQNRNRKYGDLSPTDVFSLRDLNPKKVPKRHEPVRVMLPIVDWPRQRVFDYIASAGAKVNPLYARGHKRVGCYPCLLAGPRDWRLAARYEDGRAMLEAFNKLKWDTHDYAANTPARKPVIWLKDDTISRDIDAMLWAESSSNPAFDPFNLLHDEEDGGGCDICAG